MLSNEDYIKKRLEQADTMECILTNFFGGGDMDWANICETEYEWCEIVDYIKDIWYGVGSFDYNDILYTILQIATTDFLDLLEEHIRELESENCDKDYIEKLKTIKRENFDYFINSIDTHISLKVANEEIEKIIEQDLSYILDRVNNNIGFCEIEIGVES